MQCTMVVPEFGCRQNPAIFTQLYFDLTGYVDLCRICKTSFLMWHIGYLFIVMNVN